MFKRFKRFIALSKKDSVALKRLEDLTEEQLAILPDAGDGKAVFFGPGTEEEFNEQEKADKGFKGLFGL